MLVRIMVKRQGDILKRFGAKLRRLRDEQKRTQETFAFDCGLDRTYISDIERGQRNVALRNIEKIAEALGISIPELFEDV